MAILSDTKPLHAQGCLFCLRTDGGFASREHVVSESLGNHETILQPGVVCDRCNNGPLAVADEALINFPPISLRRAERGLPTKEGKPVASKWGNATVVFSARGTMEVLNPGRKAVQHMHKPEPGTTTGSHGQLNLHSGGPITTTRMRRIVRSIWKSTLEFVYLDHGAATAFGRAFDPARRAVLGEANPHGWAALQKQGVPIDSVQLTYGQSAFGEHTALPIRMNVLGVVFFTDLLLRDVPEDAIRLPAPSNMWRF